MIRLSVVAGQFYPDNAKELEASIKQMLDEKTEKEDVLGVVVPHAGYQYSGPVVGAVVSRIRLTDTVIILGPNHTGYGKPFSISTEGKWNTPLGNVAIDSDLAKRLSAKSRYLHDDYDAHRYEHSIEVQLPFLQYFKKNIKFVPIVITTANLETYQGIGKEIARAIKEVNRPVIVMASSDMTHYEPDDAARLKDDYVIQAMLNLDEEGLVNRIEERKITMCGFAPAAIMITAVKELGANGAELVKYMTSGDTTGERSAVVGYAGLVFKGVSPLVKLAHETVAAYVLEHKVIKPPVELTSEMKETAGVFVSIHKHDNLRGCIGTFEPTTENVAQEVIQNAISSAIRDPRFSPITAEELPDLEISVDVLTTPEPIDSEAQLDPRKYGAIVECGWRKGLLLPDLEGVDTAEQQVSICCAKGGIGPKEKYKLYRFEVKRYK